MSVDLMVQGLEAAIKVCLKYDSDIQTVHGATH